MCKPFYNKKYLLKRNNIKIKCTSINCATPKKKMFFKNYLSHLFECLKRKGMCPNNCGHKIETYKEGNIHFQLCINF